MTSCWMCCVCSSAYSTSAQSVSQQGLTLFRSSVRFGWQDEIASAIAPLFLSRVIHVIPSTSLKSGVPSTRERSRFEAATSAVCAWSGPYRLLWARREFSDSSRLNAICWLCTSLSLCSEGHSGHRVLGRSGLPRGMKFRGFIRKVLLRTMSARSPYSDPLLK